MKLRSLCSGVLVVVLAALPTILACHAGLIQKAGASTPPSPTLESSAPVPAPGSAINRTRINLGPDAGGCLTSYQNITNLTGEYYVNQNGKEVLDDLHMPYEGSLCSFRIGYQENTTAPFSATIAFYANDALDPEPGLLMAGPYVVNGLPWGMNELEVTVGTAPYLTEDIWMSVQFSSTTAGLLIVDPPTTGTSHDYFYQRPAETYLWFGGDPKANFYMEVNMEVPVPAQHTTWGKIKSRYQ